MPEHPLKYGNERPFWKPGNGALVSVVMGSDSDWPECMRHACETLDGLHIPFETGVVSAHRTWTRLVEFATTAKRRGIKVIIAGAGGAAHLPGMIASMTSLPVHGVPVESKKLKGMDSLLSIVQMPGGVPTAAFAIGESGAKNAALQAARVLALKDTAIDERLVEFIEAQTSNVPVCPYAEKKKG